MFSRKSGLGKKWITPYAIIMREWLQEMTDLVQANLTKAQKKQKQHYDEKARPQTFYPGDKVLVLVPDSGGSEAMSSQTWQERSWAVQQ